MRISSPQQSEMPLDTGAATLTSSNVSSGDSFEGSNGFEFPDLGPANFAETARLAGRLNAASASTTELHDLLAERQTLLDKKFANQITPSEENRLNLVRWSIDRIQSARSEFSMSELEHLVDRYEQLLGHLESLGDQIASRTGGVGGRGKRRR